MRFPQLGLGTRLSLLVLAGTALCVAAAGFVTASRMHDEAIDSTKESADKIVKQAISALEYFDKLHEDGGYFQNEAMAKEVRDVVQGAHGVRFLEYWVDEKGHQVHLSEKGFEHAEAVLSRLNMLPEGGSLYEPHRPTPVIRS